MKSPPPAMLVIAAALLAGGASPGPPREELEASLKAALQAELRQAQEDRLAYPRPDSEIRYTRAFVDLNGDGRMEALAYVTSSYLCGSGGCALIIFERRDEAWRLVGDLSITRPPIRVLNGRHHGWRDLSVFVAGGGALPPYQARIPFDGQAYVENPSVPPAEPLEDPDVGELLITADEPSQPLF